MLLYHRTTEENYKNILIHGLKPGSPTHLILGGSWSFDIYGINPIFLGIDVDSLDKYKESSPVLFSINIPEDIELISDLPTLVDFGAYYDLDSDSIWWKNIDDTPDLLKDFLDDNRSLSIAELINSATTLCEMSIQTTKTACLIDYIPVYLIKRIG